MGTRYPAPMPAAPNSSISLTSADLPRSRSAMTSHSTPASMAARATMSSSMRRNPSCSAAASAVCGARAPSWREMQTTLCPMTVRAFSTCARAPPAGADPGEAVAAVVGVLELCELLVDLLGRGCARAQHLLAQGLDRQLLPARERGGAGDHVDPEVRARLFQAGFGQLPQQGAAALEVDRGQRLLKGPEQRDALGVGVRLEGHPVELLDHQPAAGPEQ